MQAVSETEMDLGEQQQIDDEMLEESELEEQEPGEPVEEEPIPYSINAFQQLDLVGTDLRFEAVEASNAAYVRHRISYLSNGVRIS